MVSEIILHVQACFSVACLFLKHLDAPLELAHIVHKAVVFCDEEGVQSAKEMHTRQMLTVPVFLFFATCLRDVRNNKRFSTWRQLHVRGPLV